MKDKLFFRGIYGDDTIDMVRDIIHIAPIEITGMRHNWNIRPHVHSELFQIFIIEEGSVELLINDDVHKIECVSFFTVPKNITHGLEMNPQSKGWVISLHDKALENMLKLDADIILQMDEINISKLDGTDKLVTDTYSTIHKCIYEFGADLPAKQYALQYLVAMLLLRLYRISVASSAIKISDNKNKIHFRHFVKLIKEMNSFKVSIEDYAQAMHISTGHLNRVCKDVSGLSPKDVAIDFFIDEAKALLANLDFPISEIAYKIDIEDPAYFTRLFKKRTGITPKEFRNKLQN